MNRSGERGTGEERTSQRPVEGLDPFDHAHPYCPRCRGTMSRRVEGGALRPVCPACGYVQYINPAPGAGVVIERGDRVCLVRRRFPPKAGQWTLPIGYMEWGEEVQTTAIREAREETGLDVALDGVFGVYTGVLPPNFAVVVTIFRARELGGTLRAGDDADEVGFFRPHEPPGPIAFAIHRQVLRELQDERERAAAAGSRIPNRERSAEEEP